MSTDSRQPPPESFAHGIARAFAGAVLFSLPLLMTMEIWALGTSIRPVRLALLMLLMIPLLIGLDHVSGFRRNETWLADALDGVVGYGVGILAAAAGLALFGVLHPGDPADAVAGRVILAAVPAGYGAVLANSQLAGIPDDEGDEGEGDGGSPPAEEAPYGRELFLMLAGALFLSLQVAPTREIPLIAAEMGPWRALALLAVSVVLLHIFVYRINFRGRHRPHAPGWQLLIRYSAVGYLLAALTSAYILWTFGALDGTPLAVSLSTIIVLSFPGSLGAAAARLLV